jgi:competence protein ComEA
VSRALRGAAAALLLTAAGPALAKKRPPAAGEHVDLNRASVAELMRLPGLGRKRAEAIVAQRNRQPFHAPAEVTRVKGVSEAWFQKNRAFLTAGGTPAPLPAPAPLTPAPARR